MLKKEKQLLFQRQAQVAAALAHPLRIAILDFLKSGPQCVCDIANHIGAERSNVSRHLAVMVSAGLLEYRKEGLNVIYELKAPCILDFFSCINTCLKQNIKQDRKLLQVL
jgi:ArsR family transcriptional regulator